MSTLHKKNTYIVSDTSELANTIQIYLYRQWRQGNLEKGERTLLGN